MTKHGPVEKGMANHLSILALRARDQYERQNNKTLKNKSPRSLGAQYTMVDQWRNNSRKNEEREPKQKQHPVMDATGDGSKA